MEQSFQVGSLDILEESKIDPIVQIIQQSTQPIHLFFDINDFVVDNDLIQSIVRSQTIRTYESVSDIFTCVVTQSSQLPFKQFQLASSKKRKPNDQKKKKTIDQRSYFKNKWFLYLGSFIDQDKKFILYIQMTPESDEHIKSDVADQQNIQKLKKQFGGGTTLTVKLSYIDLIVGNMKKLGKIDFKIFQRGSVNLVGCKQLKIDSVIQKSLILLAVNGIIKKRSMFDNPIQDICQECKVVDQNALKIKIGNIYLCSVCMIKRNVEYEALQVGEDIRTSGYKIPQVTCQIKTQLDQGMCFNVDMFCQLFKEEFALVFPGDEVDIQKDTRVNLYIQLIGDIFLIKVSKTQISIFQKKNFQQIKVLKEIIEKIIKKYKKQLQLNCKFTSQHLSVI